VVIVSPDRLARHYAPQWLLSEALEKMPTPLSFLPHPFGDRAQGHRLTPMPGMIAADERAQMAERTRRGRLEKARPGACLPWAYTCYGDRYLPKRHGGAPQVMIDPGEAAVVRDISRAWVEEQRRCRQSTQRLPAATTPTPTGKNAVWHPAPVRHSLTNRVYAGQARYHSRQPVLPQYRKQEEHRRQYLKTGRSERAESAWVGSEAPALISVALFDKAPRQRPRPAASARKMSPSASRRYGLRTLVQCGECGLGMVCIRQRSVGKKYAYLYDEWKGHSPLSVGRTTTCPAKLVRAERLDPLGWHALEHLRHQPSVIPQRPQTWAEATQHNLAGLEAHQAHWVQRRQRIERQAHRLLEA
jgi:site-specific DNA recombinase